MIDTHSHIYSEEFDDDLAEAILRAKKVGVTKIILPNVDVSTIERLHKTEKEHEGYCFAAMGLHPTSVKQDYKDSLQIIESNLKKRSYVAIGEIGIDLFWDKSFLKEQIFAFEQQIEWSLQYNLPIIVHMRDSFEQVMASLLKYKKQNISGIFHSFTGSESEAKKILSLGNFKLGINGIATFKNSGLDKTLAKLKLENLVLETDSPYLAPIPFRGKRNETAYLLTIAQKIAEIYDVPLLEVEEITNNNAKSIFKKIGV